jgi:hypothetical protein
MHITYADTLDSTCLQQGDVLRRTGELNDLLNEIHPHYGAKEDYRFLMVLTQSCDLVRRFQNNTACKARYITVAAVRPLSLVIDRELEKGQHSDLERAYRLCSTAHRDRLFDFLSRLLNNNEPEYFYLHPEPSLEYVDPHCAFLTLSVPLKSELHYEKCLAAKVLQLNDAFQHKLGWLTGNLYSRVGTEDVVPAVFDKAQFEKHVGDRINDACAWFEPALRSKLMTAIRKIPDEERTTEKVLATFEALKGATPKKKDELIERLQEILQEVGVAPSVVKTAMNLVRSDSDVARLLPK